MIHVATWLREKDVSHFRDAFAFAPDVVLQDARTQPVVIMSCDALLLTGGEDVDASSLRQPIPTPSPIRATDPARDAWEIAATREAVAMGMPILAICRGHQLLNVALGGTLHLHIDGHHHPDAPDTVHALRYAARMPSWRVFERVNSTHHQAIDRPAEVLEVEAWSVTDGVIEQVRHRTLPWCIGVQYHPERGPHYRSLFAAYVEAIRAYTQHRDA